MNPIKRFPLRLTAGVALVAVTGSVALAKATSGARGGPELAAPFAFLVLFVATITLLAVAIVSCQRLVDEMDAAHPLKVRNRGALSRLVKRICRRFFALAGRASRAWLRWLSAASVVLWGAVTRICRRVLGLAGRAVRAWLGWLSVAIVVLRREMKRTYRAALDLAGRARRICVRWASVAIAVLRRELTRDALERRGRALAIALSGVPPDERAPLPFGGPLARPERVQASHWPRRTLPRRQHRASPRSGPPRNQALSALARLAGQTRRHDKRART